MDFCIQISINSLCTRRCLSVECIPGEGVGFKSAQLGFLEALRGRSTSHRARHELSMETLFGDTDMQT